MRFHAQDGWHFERLEGGSVLIWLESAFGVAAAVELSADAWASAVAAVSARGSTTDARQAAQELHSPRWFQLLQHDLDPA